MANDDFIWRFTPSRTEPELLEAIFVQREPLLQDLLERVAESANTGSKHHVLLIGPRGFGKTHLITLLNYRLSKDRSMADRIRVAWLLEDETITSFVQLLKRIYEILAQQYPAEFPLAWLTELLDEPPKRIKGQLQQRLIQAFSQKTLLLCIENLDILFNGLGADGQHEWRAFLQEHPFTTIMASTQRLFADVKLREKPFFGFFNPIPLEPLNVDDAVELLRRVAKNRTANDLVAFLESAEGRSRVRALHHLAGGNHRIYVVLSGFITRESLDDLVGPFQKMADDLTPYYQERLRWLSPQQRQIIEYLCSQDRPCMPKQIARHLLATESSISSQMKKLLEIGYVLRAERGRESLYELAEPLMRLASEVKEQHRRPLQMLVNFLRVWYRPDDLPRLMQQARTDSLRRHISAAIEASRLSPDPRLRILNEVIANAREENKVAELIAVLEEKAAATNTADDWYELAYAQRDLTEDYEIAIQSTERCLQIDPAHARAWFNKGWLLDETKRYDEAITCYDEAIRADAEFASAWNGKGCSLHNLMRYEEVIACYDKAIELDPGYAYAWNNKGYSLHSSKRYDEAITCYDKAIELDPADMYAWNNKGWSLNDLKRYDEAIACCDKAIELDPGYACAWNTKGNSLYYLTRCHEAIACYDKAIELDPAYATPWSNKGAPLHNLKRYDEAIACCDKAIQLDPADAAPWDNKGNSLHCLKRYEEAVACAEQEVALNPSSAVAWNSLAFRHYHAGRATESVAACEKAIGCDPDHSYAYFTRVEALFTMQRWTDGLAMLRVAFERFSGEGEGQYPEWMLDCLRKSHSSAHHPEVRHFLRLYVEFNGLATLGDGLVRSLPMIDLKSAADAALYQWRDLWFEAGAPYPDLQTPLRIFSVGIEYLVKQDRKVLLDLVVAERQILEQALGLE